MRAAARMAKNSSVRVDFSNEYPEPHSCIGPSRFQIRHPLNKVPGYWDPGIDSRSAGRLGFDMEFTPYKTEPLPHAD